MSALRITEIFYSIQGESSSVGHPTVFIRLTGCPLRCSYCDTTYAFNGGERIDVDDILARLAGYNTRFVTVTGGEPLAQPECHDLMTLLADKGYRVSLETSGAMDISKVDNRVIKVMDLKTPSSGEESKNRMQNLDFLQQDDQVKFVVGNESDYQWAKNKIKRYRLDERCEVLFSPVTGQMCARELADKILRDQLRVRFQVQLHKLLWGDVAGK